MFPCVQHWLALNHIKALWRVVKAETWLGRLLCNVHIGFAVTRKGGGHKGDGSWWALLTTAMAHLWLWVLYALTGVAAMVYFVVHGYKSGSQLGAGGLLSLVACSWILLATL
jgi:hypothetical protein